MTTAAELASQRVAVGGIEQRLADVAPQIRQWDAHHCVVVNGHGDFVGLVRLADVAGYAQGGNRLLGDLISPVQPLVVRPAERADDLARLFEGHRLFEAVIQSETGKYLGLITAESVLAWTLRELKRRDETAKQLQARLDLASQARDIFIRSLSHELRTPLNPVLLLATEGAANQALPGDVREKFEVIATNTLLEAHLIDSLLDLTRAAKGNIRIEFDRVDINALLQELLVELNAGAGAPGHLLLGELGAGNATVSGDADKLRQAFGHLLRHAVRRTAARGRIIVRTHLSGDSQAVVVTVQDDGPRLSPAELERVFDAFPDVDTANPFPQKISMGLVLVQAIVLLHSGHVQASAGDGGDGLLISLQLPVLPAATGQQLSGMSSRADVAS